MGGSGQPGRLRVSKCVYLICTVATPIPAINSFSLVSLQYKNARIITIDNKRAYLLSEIHYHYKKMNFRVVKQQRCGEESRHAMKLCRGAMEKDYEESMWSGYEEGP